MARFYRFGRMGSLLYRNGRAIDKACNIISMEGKPHLVWWWPINIALALGIFLPWAIYNNMVKKS